MYAQVTAGLATSITIATMLSAVDTSLAKRALKTFGDRLKVLRVDDTGGVISQGLRLPTAKECKKYILSKLLEGVFDLRPET